MNNANNGDNEDPPLNNVLAIESLEDYLQRYGLPSNNSNDDDGRNGEFNGLNRSEAQERMEAEKAYLDAFIERHHDNTTDNNSSVQTGFTPRGENDPENNGTISILLANQKQRYNVPMKSMYRYCETVRRMTVHRSRFGVVDSDQEEEENSNSDSLELLKCSVAKYSTDVYYG